jgi:hypothetical protein
MLPPFKHSYFVFFSTSHVINIQEHGIKTLPKCTEFYQSFSRKLVNVCILFSVITKKNCKEKRGNSNRGLKDIPYRGCPTIQKCQKKKDK